MLRFRIGLRLALGHDLLFLIWLLRKDEGMDGAESRMMGVGCIAGQRTLSRVLGRLMRAYSLGNWTDAMRLEEGTSAGSLALRKLISGDPVMTGTDGNGPADEKITGFFLAYKNRRLSLSVFTRRQGMRCGEYTVYLNELTFLRRSRMH
jgi:hypothetical protein